MTSRPRYALAVLIAVGTVACQQDSRISAGLGSEVRDSAGIRIVENVQPRDRSRLSWRIGSWFPKRRGSDLLCRIRWRLPERIGSRIPCREHRLLSWRIGPQPTVAAWVPGHLHDGSFFTLDATKLPDGRIVVAHSEDHLLVFEASGASRRYWDGRHRHPSGELTGETGRVDRAYWVAPWPGDSIIVAGRSRETGHAIDVFDQQGNYGRHFQLNDLQPVDVTNDGSILTASDTDHEDSIAVQLRDSEGELRSSLGMHAAAERHQIFGREPVLAPWGELVVVGNTSRYELRAFRADGSLARIVRRNHVLRPATPDHVEAYIDELVAEPYGNFIQEGREQLQSRPVADHLPVFARVMSDASGHLWVQEYPAPTEESSAPLWAVFDPEGRVLGFVETPAGLLILEIGEDYILGTSQNESSKEHVQLWPLRRWGTGGG